MTTIRYLTIHFAPTTQCVTVEINENTLNALMGAMDKHHGEITLKVSTYHEIATKMTP